MTDQKIGIPGEPDERHGVVPSQTVDGVRERAVAEIAVRGVVGCVAVPDPDHQALQTAFGHKHPAVQVRTDI